MTLRVVLAVWMLFGWWPGGAVALLVARSWPVGVACVCVPWVVGLVVLGRLVGAS